MFGGRKGGFGGGGDGGGRRVFEKRFQPNMVKYLTEGIRAGAKYLTKLFCKNRLSLSEAKKERPRFVRDSPSGMKPLIQDL